MENRWFRKVVCLGVGMSFLILGVPAVLSMNCENGVTTNTYNEDGYYEDYNEDGYNEKTYYKDYYYKGSYYKGNYYNDYYKVYRYSAYEYVVFNYLKNLLERFPLLEKILANSLCLD